MGVIVNRVGIIHNNFKIVKDTGKRSSNGGNVIYLVQCLICNGTLEVSYCGLMNRKSTSCDLCRFTLHRENKIVNNWHIIKAAYIDEGNYIYFCLCLVCNTLRLTQVTNIFSGKSKSCCGKYLHDKAALNILYKRQIFFAKERKKKFELTFEEFESLVTRNCHYCDSLGRTEVYHKGSDSYHYFSGIDRIDPNIGYVRDNCVPCCRRCNFAKLDSSVKVFERYLDNLTEYRITPKERKNEIRSSRESQSGRAYKVYHR